MFYNDRVIKKEYWSQEKRSAFVIKRLVATADLLKELKIHSVQYIEVVGADPFFGGVFDLGKGARGYNLELDPKYQLGLSPKMPTIALSIDYEAKVSPRGTDFADYTISTEEMLLGKLLLAKLLTTLPDDVRSTINRHFAPKKKSEKMAS